MTGVQTCALPICSVVDTESEFAVFFLDEHDRRRSSRPDFSNPSSLLVLFEVSVQFLNLIVAKCINLLDWHLLSLFELDS